MPEPAHRIAALDCGTNSLRLLILERGPSGSVELVREARFARLGEGVDRSGRLGAAALGRVDAVLAEFAGLIRFHGVAEVRMVATSAVRDAENPEDFVAVVRRRLGIEPEIITGATEARLSFAGAVAGLRGDAEIVVADIGGGSTELAAGTVRSGVRVARSLDIGAVRLTERHLHADPATPAQWAEARATVDSALDSALAEGIPSGTELVAVAGTALTVAAVARVACAEGPARSMAELDGAVLEREQVRSVTELLSRADRQERAALGVIAEGRLDVIAAGAMILEALMQSLGSERVTVSLHDILDGLAAAPGASGDTGAAGIAGSDR